MTTATNGSREPFVSIRNLTKRFGDLVAVDDVSLSVGEGHTLALLGPSGCGKTTILRCIAGLETPDQGHISIAGRVAFDAAQGIELKPEQRELGVVFQSYAVWPHMTVEQNVGFPLKVRKRPIERAARSRRAHSRSRRPRGVARQAGDAIVRRPAAARRARARAGLRAAPRAVRRADVEPRRAIARPDADRAEDFAEPARLHRDLCDPRPGRGVRACRERGPDEPRQGRNVRCAARRFVPSAHAVRRALPRA